MKVIKGINKGEVKYPKQLKDILKDVTPEEIKLNAEREFEANKEALIKKEEALKAEAQLNRITKIAIEKSKELWETKTKASRKNPRVRISEEKKAFDKWVIENDIDLNKITVNGLEIEIDVAFSKNKFPYKLVRSTLGDYLKDWKEKNRPR